MEKNSGHGARLSAVDLASTYVSVWNALDSAERERRFEQVWADDAVLIQPRAGRLGGRAAVLRQIAGFSERFPGARVVLTSGVDEHHGWLRYSWRIEAGDGSSIVGMDVAELDASGKFRQIVQFDGPLLTLS